MNGVYFSFLYIKADNNNSGLNTYVLYNIYNAKHNSQKELTYFTFKLSALLYEYADLKKSFLDFEILMSIHQAIVKMMINLYKTILNSYIKGVEYDMCQKKSQWLIFIFYIKNTCEVSKAVPGVVA